MKKHSKTGVDSRYQGTILGKPAELRPVKIEGGPVESIDEWCRKTRERAAKVAESLHGQANHLEDASKFTEESYDGAMES